MSVGFDDIAEIKSGYDPAPERSFSLPSRFYIEPGCLEFEKRAIFQRSWQFVCHMEKLTEPGSYIAFDIQGQSVFAVRDGDGVLRAFYNVCRHRAHELAVGRQAAPKSSPAPTMPGPIRSTAACVRCGVRNTSRISTRPTSA